MTWPALPVLYIMRCERPPHSRQYWIRNVTCCTPLLTQRRGCRQLTALHCGDCPRPTPLLLHALANLTQLKTVCLRHEWADRAGEHERWAFLQQWPDLVHLSLQGERASAPHGCPPLQFLHADAQLTHLGLHAACRLRAPPEAPALMAGVAHSLARHTGLQVLVLSECGMGDDAACGFGGSLFPAPSTAQGVVTAAQLLWRCSMGRECARTVWRATDLAGCAARSRPVRSHLGRVARRPCADSAWLEEASADAGLRPHHLAHACAQRKPGRSSYGPLACASPRFHRLGVGPRAVLKLCMRITTACRRVHIVSFTYGSHLTYCLSCGACSPRISHAFDCMRYSCVASTFRPCSRL
jgi:hypothetical protein